MVWTHGGDFCNRGHYVTLAKIDQLGTNEMPRIPGELLDAVFYLYPSPEAARAGSAAGGTGVFVGVDIPEVPGASMFYACSNKHVVGDSGCSVIRVNRTDGGVHVFDYDPAQWFFDPHNDLAVAPLRPAETIKLRVIHRNMFVSQEEIRDKDAIGPGEEIFMTGRFINHDGNLINTPSVRFGHLSMMPSSIRHPAGYDQESFAVEMLSRPGYSGSPVYVYQTPYDLRTGNMSIGPTYMKLLGINWGFIADPAEVKEELVTAQHSTASGQKTVRYVPMNTGMNGVVPAWHLLRFLETGPVMEARKRSIAAHIAKQKLLEPKTILATSVEGEQTTDENPNGQEDFKSLLNAAAQKQKPDDQTS
jgi:hypothetical protein